MFRKLVLGSLFFVAISDVLAAYTMRRLGRHLAGGQPPAPMREPATAALPKAA